MAVFTPSGKEYPRKWGALLQRNMLNTSKKLRINKILEKQQL
jgi:hypothetical protein